MRERIAEPERLEQVNWWCCSLIEINSLIKITLIWFHSKEQRREGLIEMNNPWVSGLNELIHLTYSAMFRTLRCLKKIMQAMQNK